MREFYIADGDAAAGGEDSTVPSEESAAADAGAAAGASVNASKALKSNLQVGKLQSGSGTPNRLSDYESGPIETFRAVVNRLEVEFASGAPKTYQRFGPTHPE